MSDIGGFLPIGTGARPTSRRPGHHSNDGRPVPVPQAAATAGAALTRRPTAGHGEVVMKRLVLMRHAKSSWADPDLADHDRPLNGRGRRAATTMGRHLRTEVLVPDLVLCSTAARARETLTRLDLPDSTDVQIEADLYGADPDEIFDRLRRVSDGVGSVLVIAHNPGLEELTGVLTEDEGSLPDRFPTAAVAELRLPIARWSELAPHTGALTTFVTPRALDVAD
jgi:phosphohistidine phosphatase